MARMLSRNTKVENVSKSSIPLVVKVTQDPGNFKVKEFSIPAGAHEYLCHNDFDNEHNPDRPFNARVNVGDDPKYLDLRTSQIRDYGIIQLDYENGRVTAKFIKMRMVARIGLVIRMKGATKKIKSCWGKNDGKDLEEVVKG